MKLFSEDQHKKKERLQKLNNIPAWDIGMGMHGDDDDGVMHGMSTSSLNQQTMEQQQEIDHQLAAGDPENLSIISPTLYEATISSPKSPVTTKSIPHHDPLGMSSWMASEIGGLYARSPFRYPGGGNSGGLFTSDPIDKMKVRLMELRDVLETVHEAGYVLIVFEPIVRAIAMGGCLFFKAAEFVGNAVAVDSIVVTANPVAKKPRSRYVSPEMAKALCAGSEGPPTIIATAAIAIFAFGLYLWEYYNHRGDGCKSLWACLGVDATDDWAVIRCAASLTDEQVQRCVEATFRGIDNNNAFVCSLLLDCLRVAPLQRASARKLKGYSLLSHTSTLTTPNTFLASVVLPEVRAAVIGHQHTYDSAEEEEHSHNYKIGGDHENGAYSSSRCNLIVNYLPHDIDEVSLKVCIIIY